MGISDDSDGEICATEGLALKAFKAMIEQYHFSEKIPLQGAVVEALQEKPKIHERKRIIDVVTSTMLKLVSTFDDGIS